jgi:hypothetical protein
MALILRHGGDVVLRQRHHAIEVVGGGSGRQAEGRVARTKANRESRRLIGVSSELLWLTSCRQA